LERDDEISEYLSLSRVYFEAGKLNFENDLFEPALFNSIHALELAVKSLLLKKLRDNVNTHNVGGLLGKYYRKDLGEDICRDVNRILMRYNLPRYPGVMEYQRKEILQTLDLVESFLSIADPIINGDHTCCTDLNQSTSDM
jgi:HEPN domain-containing protein